MADIEKGIPLAEDTIYHIYSMSKPVTTVALLVLMEEGDFQLDQPAADFIPELGALRVLEKITDEGRCHGSGSILSRTSFSPM